MALTNRIIPCIDVDLDSEGNAVVYTGINFENLRYTGDPVEMAKKYNNAGADELDLKNEIERKDRINRIERIDRIKTRGW